MIGPPPGDALPLLRTPVPGPASRALAERLARVESRNITRISPDGPVVWTAARGANVTDADGNIFIDLTAGFGVSAAGHATSDVARAVSDQIARLPHALGDVHPADVKVRLLERLTSIAPDGLEVGILGSAGAEAVEAVLKTAVIKTGRPGIIAFEGAYHGLTYGALACTFDAHFRAPFVSQLFDGVRFAPFPLSESEVASALARVREMITDDVGVVLIEPVQGRGGLRVAPDAFLRALRELCDGESTLLAFDEVYTGIGRTGKWFACEHSAVTPDLIAVGKALGGGLPLSAALGTREVMDAWPVSTGEAIHTSTFLGNPVACAAALAQLDAIERQGLIERAADLGRYIRQRTESWVERGLADEARGIGLLQGVRVSPASRGIEVADRVLREGVLLVTESFTGDVLAITPPAVITIEQLDFALDRIEEALA